MGMSIYESGKDYDITITKHFLVICDHHDYTRVDLSKWRFAQYEAVIKELEGKTFEFSKEGCKEIATLMGFDLDEKIEELFK